LAIAERDDSISNIERLPNDSGMVIENKKTAVYNDDKGKVHKYSAICTHLGCIVGWNELEKSFDCPCHGSRFSGPTGKVINGPANTALGTKDND
jgi:Rieske Fe-S protein